MDELVNVRISHPQLGVKERRNLRMYLGSLLEEYNQPKTIYYYIVHVNNIAILS